MDKTSFASMLFFTRAAVRRDQALASARIDSPAMFWFGRAWTQKHAVNGLSTLDLSFIWNLCFALEGGMAFW